MRNEILHPKTNQLAFPGYWLGKLWGGGYYQEAEFTGAKQENLQSQKGNCESVIEAKFEQTCFIGQVKRGKVAVSVNSILWRKLPVGWKDSEASP
jgi:hypothetical protein